MIRPEVLLFDWDNTLVDGWRGITAALNAALDAFDKPRWSLQETKERARVSLKEAFPVLFGPGWERARDIFYDRFQADHLAHVAPMDGAEAALTACTAWPRGVVSNKKGDFLRAEVAFLGWDHHFSAVIGAGDAAADKPDPAPIHLALKRMGFEASPSVWYLGDTAMDMKAARAAGVTAVLVGDADHDGGVAQAAPDIHVHGGHDLAALLKSLA